MTRKPPIVRRANPCPPRHTNLDLGKLLRMHEMVTQAARVEAVRDSAGALVHAYQVLRAEMLTVLEPPEVLVLREEFERLFQPLDEPHPFNPMFGPSDQVRLASAAEEARMRLGLVGGWIQGLINEMTLQERMRLEAEANALLANKPTTGFAP